MLLTEFVDWIILGVEESEDGLETEACTAVIELTIEIPNKKQIAATSILEIANELSFEFTRI